MWTPDIDPHIVTILTAKPVLILVYLTVCQKQRSELARGRYYLKYKWPL